MMRAMLTPTSTLAMLLLACTTPDTPGPADTDEVVDPGVDTDAGPGDDTDVDTDAVDDTDVDTDTDPEPFEVTFTRSEYKVTRLEIRPVGRGSDLNGDGLPDNRLASVLELVDALPIDGDFSLSNLNGSIQSLLDEERAIVLMEAAWDADAEELTVDIVWGERDSQSLLHALPESYGEDGLPASRLVGTFTSPEEAAVGPASVSLPIQLFPGDPILVITAENAIADGDVGLSAIRRGHIAGAFLVSTVMADIVEPLILDYYGPGDQADGLIASTSALLSSGADLMVNGQPAISGSFNFEAEYADWSPPAP